MEILKDGDDLYICLSMKELKDLNNDGPVHNFDNGYTFVLAKDDPKAFLAHFQKAGWKKPRHLSLVNKD